MSGKNFSKYFATNDSTVDALGSTVVALHRPSVAELGFVLLYTLRLVVSSSETWYLLLYEHIKMFVFAKT